MSKRFGAMQRKVVLAALPLCMLATAECAAAGNGAVATRFAVLAAQTGGAIGVSPEQRLRDEMRLLLLEMIESGAFGQTPPEQISLSIDAPRERLASLGILVDSSAGSAALDGLHVLGTTPGSTAARIGLRAGDTLLSINRVSLANLGDGDGGVAKAALVLRDEVARSSDGATLDFEVKRDGTRSTISGVLAGTWIPALHLRVGDGVQLASSDAASGVADAAGCGRISIFDVAPRQRQLHAATLISIDGRRSPFDGQTSFRVSAGRHVLTVGERIDSRYLGFNDRLRNSDNGERYKTLTVEVAPDTTYSLAAQINQDKRNVWRDGAFWDPVIWHETTEPCR
ncbi:MAG TPA: PDZ domain-containing protein [Dokdonella sp.]|uniref:PDZ domain-containing protein n=1 Tax=Dokdonella sp. TaxID=2291710 RepID=UPI002C638325|nr:PDZ domain-containing protein [Dokdonella sp.]HOX71789.1 PDZ domain-containing protein [Dokdonella sp.]HPG93470.1 PDZ domain-containing protein [Dokdonella sp.]HPN78376.1 PDZ domain-containing protein [Dokdonella sp.]